MTEQEWQIVRIVSSHATYQEASIALSQLTEDRAGYAIVPITAPDAPASGTEAISRQTLITASHALWGDLTTVEGDEWRRYHDALDEISTALAAAGSAPA
jgi:hypothetical protein